MLPQGGTAGGGGPYCALCQAGEAGSEHLLMWCLAVELGWRRYGQNPGSAAALLPRAEPEAIRFARQVVFLHESLRGRASMRAHEGARRLAKAASAHVHGDVPLMRMMDPCRFAALPGPLPTTAPAQSALMAWRMNCCKAADSLEGLAVLMPL